mgnify:CR=1 FL=1
MCIICICDKRKLTDDEIYNCWTSNHDGAGIAWAENGKVKYKKGFLELEDFTKFYKNVNVLPHVVHFRTGTSGGNGPEMTHPFIVDDKGSLDLEYEGDKSVLFHNGVITDWKDMAMTYFLSNNIKIPDGAWSDTRLLALLCSRLGYPVLDFIYGKFVVIHPSGLIVRYGTFTLDEGNYYSNAGYQSKITTYGGDSFFLNNLQESKSTNFGNCYIKNRDITEEELALIEMKMSNPKNNISKKDYSLVEEDNFKNKKWYDNCRWVISKKANIIRGNGDYYER